MSATTVANPWAPPQPDPVRDTFERAHLRTVLRGLLRCATGERVLDLGCGDGLVARLAGERLESYLGIDLHPRPGVPAVRADLREGLGQLARESFDLYVGTFGIASHLTPGQLRDLVREIAAGAPSGALVALEALGLYSLEWPGAWQLPAGPARTLPYRLSAELSVHPWSPAELSLLFEDAGLAFLGTLDRSVQAGPKIGDPRYWPGMPRLRDGFGALLAGDSQGAGPLSQRLPPLPAHPAAGVHHALAAARHAAIARRPGLESVALATALWTLEPRGGRGLGHGLLAVGRVR